MFLPLIPCSNDVERPVGPGPTFMPLPPLQAQLRTDLILQSHQSWAERVARWQVGPQSFRSATAVTDKELKIGKVS